MKQNFKNDAALIEAIRTGGKNRMDALRQIFENTSDRFKILRYLKSKGCPREDAEDIYQDAIIIFDRKVVDGEYMAMASIENFIFSIVKMNWLNKFRSYQRQSENEIEDDMLVEEDVTAYYNRKEKAETLSKVINLVNERCRKILTLFSEGLKTDAIADELNLIDKVRVQKEKYRCLNRIRQKLRANPTLAAYIKNQLATEF